MTTGKREQQQRRVMTSVRWFLRTSSLDSDGVVVGNVRRLHRRHRRAGVLRRRLRRRKAPVEHLDVGEDALPVGTLHAHHVLDVQQRRDVRLLPNI